MIGMPPRAGCPKPIPTRRAKTDAGEDARRVTRCRVCGGKDLTMVLDLGRTPLANAYLTRPTDPEKWFPLQLLFCNDCALVQLSHVVNPTLMFKEYAYRTSTSQTMPRHFGELAAFVYSNFLKSSRDLVVEVGSNDGTLLSAFKALSVRVLGVDPAENLAKIANNRGLETLPVFFDSRVAQEIRETRGPAKVIIGNNVFAHVDDLRNLMKGVALLLDIEGVFSIEVPYVGDLNQGVEYDTVYHEHLSYFSVHPIARIFSDFGFSIVAVTRLGVHGGSIRVIGKKGLGRHVHFLDFERRCGLDRLKTFESLSNRVEYQSEMLIRTLEDLRARGKKVVGYGAPAKGNTLLNYCKIGTNLIDYTIDTTPEKVGKYTPGMHLPIKDTKTFRKERPPFALMLAWNYEKEILMKEADYPGQFIIPIPYPRLLDTNNA